MANYNCKTKSKAKGFTLIEVLIALIIVAIAFFAVLRSTEYDVKTTQYLENKTLANWVAMNAMAKIKLGLITIPIQNQAATLLNHNYLWSADANESEIKDIKQIKVTVVAKGQEQPLTTIYGYAQ